MAASHLATIHAGSREGEALAPAALGALQTEGQHWPRGDPGAGAPQKLCPALPVISQGDGK